jgi:hypothetical protein
MWVKKEVAQKRSLVALNGLGDERTGKKEPRLNT